MILVKEGGLDLLRTLETQDEDVSSFAKTTLSQSEAFLSSPAAAAAAAAAASTASNNKT